MKKRKNRDYIVSMGAGVIKGPHPHDKMLLPELFVGSKVQIRKELNEWLDGAFRDFRG